MVSSFDLADIVWNLSLLYNDDYHKRLSISQNPQFYTNLTTLENGTYQGSAIANLDEPYPDTIYVITSNEHWVYFEFKGKRRAFDHVWKTKEGALGFRGSFMPSLPFSPLTNVHLDINGMLESEATVERSIPGPPLFWSRVKPPDYESGYGEEIWNWRDAVLFLWDQDRPATQIYITDH